MATLISTKAQSKKTQIVDVFSNRPVSSTGYANYGRPTFTLSFPAKEEEVQDENSKARNYRLLLEKEDMKSILNRIFNPSWSLHYFNSGKPASGEVDILFFHEMMKEIGIEFDFYRIKNPRSWNDGFSYVMAVNVEHAFHQFKKLGKFIGDISINDIEIKTEEGTWI